jgi:hypothetical protein
MICRDGSTDERHPLHGLQSARSSFQNSLSDFAVLFAEAQSAPMCSRANFVAILLSLLPAGCLIWNDFEATSVLCILVYLVWGFRELVVTIQDALNGNHSKHVTQQKLRKAALIATVITVCLILSLGLGWANGPMMRGTGQRMVVRSAVLSMLALTSIEFCAIATVVRDVMYGFGDWREKWRDACAA